MNSVYADAGTITPGGTLKPPWKSLARLAPLPPLFAMCVAAGSPKVRIMGVPPRCDAATHGRVAADRDAAADRKRIVKTCARGAPRVRRARSTTPYKSA